MNINTIGILGGSGFVGGKLANLLDGRGFKLRLLTRSRERCRYLWMLPNTRIIEVNVHDQDALSLALADCDAVINLVGILNERKDDGRGFQRVHVELVSKVVKACKVNGIRRLLHMSAMNADPFGPSYYLRTKAEAEDLVMNATDDGLGVTIFRPSVIFGPGDAFLNRFAQLLRTAPLMFPLACTNARFQPVYVGNVVEAFYRTLTQADSLGRRYDLGGAEVKTLGELVDYVAHVIGVRRVIIPLGPLASRLQANVLEFFPGKPFSRDNYRSTQEDSVCRGENGLVQLGIEPTTLGTIVPTYLGRHTQRQRRATLRTDCRDYAPGS
jgi:NADH dehydrogenase